MNDSDRKILTEEVLEEEWHHIADCCVAGVWKHWWKCSCGKDRFNSYEQALEHAVNRTFTTPQDSHDVCKKLVEKEKWSAFCYFAWQHISGEYADPDDAEDHEPDTEKLFYDTKFISELLIESPERTCQLAADFWRAQNER